jgi:actin-like protein 6A
VLLVEPAYASKADREQWAELLFETYGTPGLFMSRAGVLACYANARVTGVAIDVGAGGVTVTPVQEGYPLMGGLRRSPVGGLALDSALATLAAGKGTPLQPWLKAPKAAGAHSSSSSWGLHDSVLSWHVRDAARDARESLCRMSEVAFDAAAYAHVPSASYDLPDGSSLTLGPERFSVPELLFEPAPLLAADGPLGGSAHLYAGAAGIGASLHSAVMACDADVRRDLMANIILTGGASATEGLVERLYKELLTCSPQGTKGRLASAHSSERGMGPWLGGSILASLGTFPEVWFSKEEYREWGPKMIHRKVI